MLVLPTQAETQRDLYYERLKACIRELERRSIPILEVRDRLATSDYFRHHEHLSPSGARKVAQTILFSLDSAALSQVGK